MKRKSASAAATGPPSQRKAVGAAIRNRRKTLALTQQELAAKVKRSIPTISKIESGLHPLDVDTLSALAAALETSPTRLLWDVHRSQLEMIAGLQGIVPVFDTLFDGLEKYGVKL